FFMHSDMNFFRSSPVMPFDFVLHVAILLSSAFFLSDRHQLLNFFRSSHFLSPASLLQAFMRSCCAFSAASAGSADAVNRPRIVTARIFFKNRLRIDTREVVGQPFCAPVAAGRYGVVGEG